MKVSFVAALLLTIGITAVLIQKGLNPITTFFGMSCFLSLVFIYFVSLTDAGRKFVANSMTKSNKHFFLLPLTFTAIYLVYSMGTWTLDPIHTLYVVSYVFLPALIIMAVDRTKQKLTIRDVLLILAIWLPVDTGMIQQSWDWPLGVGKNAYTIPIGVSLALFYGASYRNLGDVNFNFFKSTQDLFFSLQALSIFLMIAIGFGFATGFIAFHPKDLTPLDYAGSFLATYFLVAIPEEVLFRGLIQNWIEKTFNSRMLSLIVASIIFGFAHLNNTPSPDWRYIFIASIAGFFYGITYTRTRSLLPAALVHTCVDVVWISFFYK